MTQNYAYQKSERNVSVGRRRPVLIALGVAMLLVVFCAGYFYVSLRNKITVFTTELERTASYLDQAGADPLTALPQAQFHLQNARSAIQPYRPIVMVVASQADWLPGGGQISSWWTFANEATLAGEEALIAANLAMRATKQGQLPSLLTAMPQLEPHLAAAHDHFLQAQAARSGLDTNWLPSSLAERADPALTQWDRVATLWPQTFDQAGLLARTLPAALGSPRPLTYLLIIQSSDNLRATGGFLTSVGTLRLEDGRLTQLDVRDVVESEFGTEWSAEEGFLSERVVPPDPVRRYLGLGHWVMRDGNWWADFPATAQQVTEFWKLAGGDPVDGVIGLTDQAIVDLLAVAGPIKLQTGEMLNSENMRTITAQHIHGQQPAKGNKQTAFFEEVAAKLVPQLEQLPPEQWPVLFQQVQKMTRRHDLLMASFDPTLALAFHELGVDGALKGQTDDYVYLVEDNLADSKLNTFVPQTLRYEVQLNADASVQSATLFIQKENAYVPGTQVAGFPLEGYYTGGRWDAQTQQWDKWEGYYGGYLRLFPSPDSQLIDATGFDDPVDTKPQHNRPVFGGYVGMWPDTQREIQFEWTPGGQPQEPGRYRLLMQRQPGALEHALTVQVHLPEGVTAVEITPSPVSVTEQTVMWHSTLDRDRTFALQLTPR
ncbi:MAG: DUF4012 domain-containing protein [Anaerolineae bacterium]|nr:DUF4012 domain-containing protein [Anaerolineae bacterium]